MDSETKRIRFEQALLPHLDAAYNLARWLAGNAHDAEDLVQDAYLRAFEHFEGFRGESARAWLLTIVRNVCFTWLARRGPAVATTEFDEKLHSTGSESPESLLLREADSKRLAEAIERLPAEYRETFVLRELEGLSYKEIADVAGIPIGTVMSRLARARERLLQALSAVMNQEP